MTLDDVHTALKQYGLHFLFIGEGYHGFEKNLINIDVYYNNDNIVNKVCYTNGKTCYKVEYKPDTNVSEIKYMLEIITRKKKNFEDFYDGEVAEVGAYA